MTTNDERAPRPTDPPIDWLPGETAPATGDETGDQTLDDTEGHSMLNQELGRTIMRDHVREADRIARDGARVREAKSSEGGFLKRFTRR